MLALEPCTGLGFGSPLLSGLERAFHAQHHLHPNHNFGFYSVWLGTAVYNRRGLCRLAASARPVRRFDAVAASSALGNPRQKGTEAELT